MNRTLLVEQGSVGVQAWRPRIVATLLLSYFVVFGMIIGAKGVLWAEVILALRLSKLDFGSALLVSPLLSVVVLLSGGQLSERFGKKRLALVALALLAAACVATAGSVGLVSLIGAFVVTGTAHGVLEMAINGTTLDWEQATGRSVMNVMHAGWSGGAVIGALLAGVLLGQGWGYGQILIALSVLCGMLLLATLPLRYPPSQIVMADAPQSRAGMRVLFTNRVLILLAVLSLLGVVGESVANQWSVIYLRELGAEAQASGAAFALFNGAMFGGRLLNAPLVSRVGARVSLYVSGVVLIIGTTLLFLPGGLALAIAALMLLGLGVAGVVPTVLSVAARVSPDNRDAVASGIMASAYVCFIVCPPLIGWLAETFTLRLAWLLVGMSGAAIVVLARSTRVVHEKRT